MREGASPPLSNSFPLKQLYNIDDKWVLFEGDKGGDKFIQTKTRMVPSTENYGAQTVADKGKCKDYRNNKNYAVSSQKAY